MLPFGPTTLGSQDLDTVSDLDTRLVLVSCHGVRLARVPSLGLCHVRMGDGKESQAHRHAGVRSRRVRRLFRRDDFNDGQFGAPRLDHGRLQGLEDQLVKGYFCVSITILIFCLVLEIQLPAHTPGR